MYVLTMDDLINATKGRTFINKVNNSTLIHTADDDILFVGKDYAGGLTVSSHGSNDIFNANTYFNESNEFSLIDYDDAMTKYGPNARVIHFSVPADKVHDFLYSLRGTYGMVPILPIMDSAEDWGEPRENDDSPVHIVVVLQDGLADNPSQYLYVFSPDQHTMAGFIAVSTLGDYDALPWDQWSINANRE